MFLGRNVQNVVQLIEPIRRYSSKPFSQLLLLAEGLPRLESGCSVFVPIHQQKREMPQ